MTDSTPAPARSAGSHASVNGIRLYREISGEGEPLVLLHGGVGAGEMFEPLLPQLAARRRVILVHLQGHGRTADIDRPLRFELMADDIAALLEHLGLERADVMGYSLGGGVALQLAIRHPARVKRLVLISVPARRDGWYPEVLASMAAMGPEAAAWMGQSPLARLYPETDWASLFTKLGELLRLDYDWSDGIAGLSSPVMLVYADADAVRPAHIVETYALLGGGLRDAGLDGSLRPLARLAIVPGATHYDVVASPLLGPLVAAFLDAALPGEGGD